MKRTRRHFDKEFKQMAVRLCLAGSSVRDVSGDLGIRPDLLRRWKREFEQYKEASFSGHGNANLTSDQKELVQLKKELRAAQLERDILKKAISIFSRGDNKYSNS